jgi:hypothetical protein
VDNFGGSAKITAASALRAHLPYAIPGSAPSLRYGLKGASLRPSKGVLAFGYGHLMASFVGHPSTATPSQIPTSVGQ